MNTVTLTGYLGSDRKIRATKERTYTRQLPPTELQFHIGDTVATEKLNEPGTHEVTYPSRDYAVLSLATNKKVKDTWTTEWHRLMVWNVDRHEHFPVRLARRGDKVRITGRPDSFETPDGRVINQIVLDRLEILKSKAPEIP